MYFRDYRNGGKRSDLGTILGCFSIFRGGSAEVRKGNFFMIVYSVGGYGSGFFIGLRGVVSRVFPGVVVLVNGVFVCGRGF